MTAKFIIDNTDPSEAFRVAVDANIAAQQAARRAQWQRGYAAGRAAQADTRNGFESPAYQRGYAVGASNAVRAREFQADNAAARMRRAWWRRFLRAILVGFAIGCLLILGLVKCAKADTLADWNLLNEVCQGGSGTASDRACAQRGQFVKRLRAEGWYRGAHGVWVSPQNVATFTRIVRSYDVLARENLGMLDSVMTGLMTDLRREVPPEAIFALWNGRAGELLANQPYAASMLMYGLPYLERTLSGKNDPRFVMVLRP